MVYHSVLIKLHHIHHIKHRAVNESDRSSSNSSCNMEFCVNKHDEDPATYSVHLRIGKVHICS